MSAPHDQLLGLHKALLAWERLSYERMHGRLSDGEFLDALTKDPWLAWINPLTTLIAASEEFDAAEISQRLRRLLVADPAGDEFQQRYAAALQQSPDVVMAHAALMRALPKKR